MIERHGSGPYRRPDSAGLPEGEQPPGLRPHEHLANRLHRSVFLQHQVWVDVYGNAHEIESMPAEHIADALAFCDAQAQRIRLHVVVDLAGECRRRLWLKDRSVDLPEPWLTLMTFGGDASEWLELTPLVIALRRKLASSRSGGKRPPRSEENETNGAGNVVAPDGWVWQCSACGKRSLDLYGFQAIDRGYDAACVLNAALVRDEWSRR